MALYDDLADVLDQAMVGTTIFLSRLRVRPLDSGGWTGFVGQGGAARIVDESSSDRIDPAAREGLFNRALQRFVFPPLHLLLPARCLPSAYCLLSLATVVWI